MALRGSLPILQLLQRLKIKLPCIVKHLYFSWLKIIGQIGKILRREPNYIPQKYTQMVLSPPETSLTILTMRNGLQ